MILSPYHNPPYRTPTPKASSASPPPLGQSPKRKRRSSTESLRVKTDVQTDQAESTTGSNSPRTKVAQKLQDLDLQQIRQPSKQIRPKNQNGIPRKRIRRTPAFSDDQTSHDTYIAETPEQNRRLGTNDATASVGEIGETPDCRRKPTFFPQNSSNASDPTTEVTDAPRASSEKLILSSSSPQPDAALPPDSSELADRSVSPLPRQEELTPDQAALTWQEDEITGHELDPSADDDGEGINGIGFKPTPAMAYARKQRRQEQVNEWKAREAKDARQRRFERRRAAGLDTAEEALAEERDAAAKRMVRFAGVG